MKGIAWCVVLVCAACSDEVLDPAPRASGDGGATGAGGSGEHSPDPRFDEICGDRLWQETLADATVGALAGEATGAVQATLPVGALSTMKMIPAHPFSVRTIRIAFGAGGGLGRVRLMTTFGRSYPGGWPDYSAEAENLVPPIDLQVAADVTSDDWIDLDVSEHGLLLEPTQHYLLVFEQIDPGPKVAIEAQAPGEFSRALLHLPGQDVPYGIDGQFRMLLRGDSFCALADGDFQFAATAPPFADEPSPGVAVTDLDGDGHDDVIVKSAAPRAYRGDGTGQFGAFASDPLALVADASQLIFGDLDNDGDQDAFAPSYVTLDGDGDGVTVLEGDCNDTDAAIPAASDVADNGLDDDCDGSADDGSDDGDADRDGASIAAGDCDDTRVQIGPGFAELNDGLDNDCNGATDETFVNHIALNDGTGKLELVANAGVETIDPTGAAALGDGNGDGVLDVYWGNWLLHYPDAPAVLDRYVTGNGDGTFTDATVAAGLEPATAKPCYGVSFTDFDGDDDQDIYVSNYQLNDNFLYENDGSGSFTDTAAAHHVQHDDVPGPFAPYPGGHSYGTAFGDLDNDGDLDFFLGNLAHPRTMPWSDPSQLYFNGGAPDFVFTDRRAELGIIYDEGDVADCLADFDNDRDLDLLVGTLYTSHFSKLYRNDGDRFSDVTYLTGTAVHDATSCAWSDVDEDGDVDLLIGDRSAETPNVHLFMNRIGNDNGWVELLLEGTGTNRDGVGARVVIEAGGVTQMREVRGGSNNSHGSRWVHFGLGDAGAIDSATVRWLGGASETIEGLAPNGRYLVVEGSGRALAR